MNPMNGHDCCSQKKEMFAENRERVKDPVCGMDVDPKNPAGRFELKGETYFFCSQNCLQRFSKSPEEYLHQEWKKRKVAESTAALPKDVIYTCPMHPEVRQVGPGSCPICGMALEPLLISLDQPEDQTEYLDMKKRFCPSAVLSLPLLAIAMGGRHLLISHALQEWMSWIEFALATPVVLWGGFPFFERFAQSLKNRNLNNLFF